MTTSNIIPLPLGKAKAGRGFSPLTSVPPVPLAHLRLVDEPLDLYAALNHQRAARVNSSLADAVFYSLAGALAACLVVAAVAYMQLGGGM